MKRYGNIYKEICDMENLRVAHRCARRDKSYYREVKMVDSDPEKYLNEIQEMLVNKTYKVSEYQKSVINDTGKERELMKLPYFPDRIIQWAVMLQIERVFLKTMCAHTCASIPERGISKGRKLMLRYLADEEASRYCLKVDIHHFYPSISHRILKEDLRRKFKDPELLWLLDLIIDSIPGDEGVPIGSYLSQYLANFYLSEMDHRMKEELHLKRVVRYMDDVVVLSDSKEELHRVLQWMMGYLKTKGLSLKGNYQIFPVDARGVDFLGFRFFHRYTLLRNKTKKRMVKTFRRIKRKADKRIMMNKTEYGAVCSYEGWMRLFDSWRLREKYLVPILWWKAIYYVKRIAEPARARKEAKKNEGHGEGNGVEGVGAAGGIPGGLCVCA